MGDIIYFVTRKAYCDDLGDEGLYAGNREYGLWVIIAALLIVFAIFGAFDVLQPQDQEMAASPTNLHVVLTQAER